MEFFRSIGWGGCPSVSFSVCLSPECLCLPFPLSLQFLSVSVVNLGGCSANSRGVKVRRLTEQLPDRFSLWQRFSQPSSRSNHIFFLPRATPSIQSEPSSTFICCKLRVFFTYSFQLDLPRMVTWLSPCSRLVGVCIIPHIS